jgi:hypothetical protein
VRIVVTVVRHGVPLVGPANSTTAVIVVVAGVGAALSTATHRMKPGNAATARKGAPAPQSAGNVPVDPSKLRAAIRS